MTFDEWLNEIEVFGFRSERLHEDINNSIQRDEEGWHCDFARLAIWLQAAYQVGYEAGKSDGKEIAKSIVSF